MFKNKIFEIEYETLISNPENKIREIIDCCELDWDPNCLLFYENKIPIKTASAVQARRPIYSSSVQPDKTLINKIFKDTDLMDF